MSAKILPFKTKNEEVEYGGESHWAVVWVFFMWIAAATAVMKLLGRLE